MGSIRAHHAAVERRQVSSEIRYGRLDAIVDVLATQLPPLKRRFRRDNSSRHRDHHSSKGMPPQFSPPPGPPCGTRNNPCPSDTTAATYSSSNSLTEPTSESASDDLSPITGTVTTNPILTATATTQSAAETTSGSTDSGSGSMNISDSAAAPFTPSFQSSTTGSFFSDNSPHAYPTSSTAAASGSDTGAAVSSQAAVVKHANKTGAIVGGILGGLVCFILLILGTLLFLRRRQRKRTPASAEFRDRYIPRSAAPPLAAQRSIDNLDELDGPPPPFTQGDFNDPLFEKIHETQQAHVHYGLTT